MASNDVHSVISAAKIIPCALICGVFNQVEGFIFDCDGVLWRGETLLEGVQETLHMLRRMGKHVIFVTNNSTKSRKGYQSKFSSMGLTVAPEEIYSSSFAAAAYLRATKFPKEK
jgi:phosphoglycolate phosphatase